MTVTWLGALEGFYGSPFSRADRLALVSWLGTQGARDYVYAPKGDPLLRDDWRAPFTDPSFFTELLHACTTEGLRLSVVVSPGLDWAGDEDIPVLVAKLGSLAALGIDSLGVAFDDVPRGGHELGAAHGRAVAAVAEALPDVRVSTCPVDYAASTATSYLRGFSDALPADMDLFWTGPAIVSPTVTAADALRLSADLGGRRLVLADNVPVNDGPMSGVLHLGPYPARDPELPSVTGGLLLNLMPLPLASRVGVAAALAWWRNPSGDRFEQWRAVLPAGLEPLARASRSWLTDPGPDTELRSWALAACDGDRRLEDWFAAGCRKDLPDDWQVELAPWLVAWELMAFGLSYVFDLARKGDAVEGALGVAEARRRMRACEQQLFGIRDAVYPVTVQDGDVVRPARSGVIEGHWLIDEVCDLLLERFFGGVA
ncbi:MAG: hypothetical protein JWM40_2089 [Frankiales bacterium]|nr:hypothetical protein [Frankiales bacterium]